MQQRKNDIGGLAPLRRLGVLGAIATLYGCSSGSLGSDVGDTSNVAPVARAQVLTAGSDMKFREGTEILLSGIASEDGDGPVLGYEWTQSAGPSVTIVERSTAVVSFTAPDVGEETMLSFDLSVVDSDGARGQAPLSLTIVPAQDGDEFLSLDLRSGAATTGTFDSIKAVLALADGGATGMDAADYAFSAIAYVAYPPRSNPAADCTLDLTALSMSVPTQTASGCLIRSFADLTPAATASGGTAIEGQWPMNAPVPAAGQTVDFQIADAWWNPRFTLALPRLDVADFNQARLDSGGRSELLDPFSVHNAQMFVAFALQAPTNQSFASLILTTANDEPIGLPAELQAGSVNVINNSGAGLPTTAVIPLETIYAGISGKESALTSEVYYNTVDPTNTRGSYNEWLLQAGLASDDQGTFRPEAVAGTGDFAHAVYVNNYDLGFGRDMYTRTDEFGNLYSVVENYATLETAVRRTDMIVAVAMELSPLGDPSDTSAEKFVKFFSYIDDGTGNAVRAGSMNFDGRGERYTPGNCIACHGGSKPPGFSELVPVAGCTDMSDAACFTWPTVNRDGDNIANGDLNATFLPWDLESFLYADTDPALVGAPARFDGTTVADDLRRDFGDFSRASQEGQLKRLNQAIYDTYCDASVEPDCTTDAARRLVEHWYGGVDADGQLLGSFDDSTAPPGWQNAEVVAAPTDADPNAMGVNPDDAEQVYQDVYAQNCRMCHTNIADDALRFDDYQAFLAEQTAITSTVFETGVMPSARLTADRFWTQDDAVAAQTLAAHFGVMAVDGQLGPNPQAVISGDVAMIGRNDPVRLSAEQSAFADAFAWDITYTAPAELANNPDFAQFNPEPVGANAEEVSFLAQRPGTYDVALSINDATAVAEPLSFTVPNFTPAPVELMLLLEEGATREIVVRDELNAQCGAGDADCVDVFGDGPSSIALDLAAWNAALNGDATVTDTANGGLTISATQPGPIDAALPYTVTDIDGEAVTRNINVSIMALSAPVAVADAAAISAQSTVSPAVPAGTLPRSVRVAVLDNDAVASSAAPLQITGFTQPVSGTVTQEGDELVYTPELGFVGTVTFEYETVDSNPTGARASEDAGTVTVNVNPTATFSSEVQSAFVTCGGSACHTSTTTRIGVNWGFYENVIDRVNLTNPRASDILEGRGVRTGHNNSWTEGNEDYNTVLRWIEEGARDN
ncbi:MAG: Ig-like domain-containing protein [Gammaproteobacteria bacterium]